MCHAARSSRKAELGIVLMGMPPECMRLQCSCPFGDPRQVGSHALFSFNTKLASFSRQWDNVKQTGTYYPSGTYTVSAERLIAE